jgi:hypothetical protein
VSAAALSGRCLCGAVQFTATPKRMEMGVCHCGMCRRWTGGAFMGVQCGPDVQVADASQLGAYQSSGYGERCFCKVCGSTLFWRMQGGAMHVVAAQAFDDPNAFAFVSEIYVDEQPGNYSFANQTKRMTGPEFVAALMAARGG